MSPPLQYPPHQHLFQEPQWPKLMSPWQARELGILQLYKPQPEESYENKFEWTPYIYMNICILRSGACCNCTSFFSSSCGMVFFEGFQRPVCCLYIRRFHTEVTSKPWRSSIAFIKSSSCWSTCWASKSNWSIPSWRVLQLHFRELTSDLILRAILDRPYEDVKTQMLRYIQQAI